MEFGGQSAWRVGMCCSCNYCRGLDYSQHHFGLFDVLR